MTLQPFALGPDEGETITYLGGRAIFKVDASQTGGWGVFQETFPAGFATPTHVHHTENGAFFVLAGEMLVKAGELEMVATPGTFVFLPKGIPHSFRVVSHEPATWINIQGPTGDFANYAKRICDQAEGAPIDPVTRASLSREFGLEVLGPPPA